jgi:MbtH protein
MTNPFEDPDGTYFVLMNDESQYSLWPNFIDVPIGWQVVHAADTRQACREYIDTRWTDMRPQSLIDAMNGQGYVGADEDGGV